MNRELFRDIFRQKSKRQFLDSGEGLLHFSKFIWHYECAYLYQISQVFKARFRFQIEHFFSSESTFDTRGNIKAMLLVFGTFLQVVR